ncbi:hypothetical protein PRIPAC_95662 [Pristionchus pacificus]|uniref:Uncharacterized protein n=1 Tax=Pristionchus pacificus TaxID=54126 RepID=A0A2A6BCI4_PRIPA|nr:hypothetical protein PRIPAC_95662 [Pristionchus pacificus]|eukprot:PDM63602.1 hypothetical protein PRIPAC_49575 [Pristionchus pacificus]
MSRAIVTLSWLTLFMLVAQFCAAPHSQRGERHVTPLRILEIIEEIIMKEACRHRPNSHVRPGK